MSDDDLDDQDNDADLVAPPRPAKGRSTGRMGRLARLGAPQNRSKLVLGIGLAVLAGGGWWFFLKPHKTAGAGVASRVHMPAHQASGVGFHAGQNSSPAYANLYDGYQKNKAGQALHAGKTYLPGYVDKAPGVNNLTNTLPASKPGTVKKPVRQVSMPANQQQATSHQARRPRKDPEEGDILAEMKQLGSSFEPQETLKVSYAKRLTENRSPTTRLTAQSGQKSGATAHSTRAAAGPALIGPGKLYYGVVDTSIDTDQPGPVLAQMEDGPLRGARLLGNFTRHGDRVVIEFNVLTMPDQASIPIKAVAVNARTNRTSVETSYNNHDFSRFAWLVAGALLQGVGQSAQQSGTSVTSSLTGFSAVTSPRSLSQDVLDGMGTVGQTLGSIGQQEFTSIKPTVRLKDGSGIGVLFLKPVSASAVAGAVGGHSSGALPAIDSGIARAKDSHPASLAPPAAARQAGIYGQTAQQGAPLTIAPYQRSP